MKTRRTCVVDELENLEHEAGVLRRLATAQLTEFIGPAELDNYRRRARWIRESAELLERKLLLLKGPQ